MKSLILGSAIVGAALLASPAQAARIVFTAAQGTAFNIPSSGTTNQQVNGGIQLSITSATGMFAGTTSFLNGANVSNIQPFRFEVPATSPSGTTRNLNYRFNNLTLVGSCAICGQQLVLNSSSATGFPIAGIGNNAGTPQAQIRGGALYGQPAITFSLPGMIGPGSVSFEANSSGLYTITIDAPDPVPAPLPLLGGAAAFGFSRRLRQRMRLSRSL